MPFKIAPRATFTQDVKIMVPVDDGFEPDTLRTTFNYVDQEEQKSFDLKTAEGTIAFLKRAVARFHDLVDEKDRPVECTDALRDRLIATRLEVRAGLSSHYFGAIIKVKEGN